MPDKPSISCGVQWIITAARTVLIVTVLALCLFVTGCDDKAKKAAADDLREAGAALTERDYIEAEKSFERYLRRSPDGDKRWYAWNNLVDLALNVRHDRKAAAELLEAMLIEFNADPQKVRAIRKQLAELYRLARRFDRAVTLWSGVSEDKLATAEERADAYRLLAGVYLRRLEFELSKESLGYCLSLEISPGLRGQCLYDMATTYIAMDELEEAAKQLRAALLLQDIPKAQRTMTTFMLADTVELQGQNKKALELFESIRTTYPNPMVIEKRISSLQKKPAVAPKPPVVPVPASRR